MTQLELHGIGHELKFWKEFVKTERFLKGWVAKIKTPELGEYMTNFISSRIAPGSRVLDIGSGVVSILNGIIPDAQLVATDPLGELYECIFDYKKYGITPPIPVPAEELKYEKEFDIVHMRNALDHSQHPFIVLMNMISACKPGGFVIVHGFENEADAENWQGFHQWNIRVTVGGHLEIQGKDGKTSTATDAVEWNRQDLGNGKTWFTWMTQRK